MDPPSARPPCGEEATVVARKRKIKKAAGTRAHGPAPAKPYTLPRSGRILAPLVLPVQSVAPAAEPTGTLVSQASINCFISFYPWPLQPARAGAHLHALGELALRSLPTYN
jgi:hypothetical protein